MDLHHNTTIPNPSLQKIVFMLPTEDTNLHSISRSNSDDDYNTQKIKTIFIL